MKIKIATFGLVGAVGVGTLFLPAGNSYAVGMGDVHEADAKSDHAASERTGRSGGDSEKPNLAPHEVNPSLTPHDHKNTETPIERLSGRIHKDGSFKSLSTGHAIEPSATGSTKDFAIGATVHWGSSDKKHCTYQGAPPTLRNLPPGSHATKKN